jgi:Plant transposon protein
VIDAEKLFCNQQEGARKAVERVFRVLFKWFQILYHPSRLWHIETTSDIVTACVIIHNMVCEERRASYSGTRALRLSEYDHMASEGEGLALVWPPEEETTAIHFWRANLEGNVEPEQHLALTNALMRHQWSVQGISTIHAGANPEEIVPDCGKFGYFRRFQIIQILSRLFSSFLRELHFRTKYFRANLESLALSTGAKPLPLDDNGTVVVRNAS